MNAEKVRSGFAHDFDAVESLQDFFPQDPELQLGEPAAHTEVDAVSERQVPLGVGSRQVDGLGVVAKDVFVSVGRQVPHEYLVVLEDLFAAEFGVSCCGASHVRQRCLPPDDLGNQVRHKRRVGDEFVVLLGIGVQAVDAARHRVAGGVVAADDKQEQVAKVGRRRHVLGGLTMCEHRDEVEAGVRSAFLPQSFEVLEALAYFVALLSS